MNHKLNFRLVVKLGGASGQGINSIGEAVAKVLKRGGWSVFGYREYPSLIKGGTSCYQLDVSDEPIQSSSKGCDVLMCLSRSAIHAYIMGVRPNGVVIHSLMRLVLTPQETEYVESNAITVVYVPAEEMTQQLGGKIIMVNTLMTGVMGHVLQLPAQGLIEVIKEAFADKPHVIDKNIEIFQHGFTLQEPPLPHVELPKLKKADQDQGYLMTGNHAIVLGAVAAGVRAYYAYPMTPSSSVLTYAAEIYHKTGMLVKQIEDEISVAQMALGSMYAGTRALVATSGGGFDLMTESLSMSGITEIPFVCVIGQRPGPATGLPTWTADGDLNLAVYAGHGEYPRCVLAASDAESCYRLVQQAFNLAEQFQVPVLVLTDKQIAESLYAVPGFSAPLPIERGLVSELERESLQPKDRYRITETGVSLRWLPGEATATYDSNSDEHLEDGTLVEDAEPAAAMYHKRMKKQFGLTTALPEPELYGPTDAAITFVGWGSPKQIVLDAMREVAQMDGPTFNYLHFESIFPVKTGKFLQVIKAAKRVVLLENNYTGQLGALLTQHTGYQWKERFLKYDGRPFFVEDILDYVMR